MDIKNSTVSRYTVCHGPEPAPVENEAPACGEMVGVGTTAEVFEDVNDRSMLYKKYDLIGNNYEKVLALAKKESVLFNRFYGDDASVIIRSNGDIYMHLIRVPGTPLDEIEIEYLPDNMELLYLDLICSLNEIGIIHGDHNKSNILFDKNSGKYFQ